MDICTIIACNYAPFARVLAESFHAHHPGARCFVLVIDDHRGRIDPAAEPFELVTPADLGIDDFERMAALYSVLELSTAVKPWLLEHLLNDRGCETLAYLDPDIEVHGSLEEIEAAVRRSGLVVTPHLTEPMPRDGRRPSETDILIAGSYNLGFVALGPGAATDRLLAWWSERLARDCIVAPERGYFVDQRWMDFAPGLVPSFEVLRDPGYNVAYWNLGTRRVRREGDGFTVDGRPLRFFHFSGFDPDQPDRLSKHQDRVELAREPALRELCRRYAGRLLERGYREARGMSYTYDRLGDGTPVDAAVREGYRAAVEAGAEPAASVFSPAGARALLGWLNGPAEEGGERGVTRYLHALWRVRPDVQAQFPDLDGRDGGRLAGWAQVHGRATVPIPPALVPGLGPGAELGRVPLGVNVAGYFGSVLGVGEAARQVVRALEAGGVQVAPVGLRAELSRQDAELGPAAAGGEPRFPVNLICVNADVLGAFAEQMGRGFFDERYSIGLWWWEVSTFPERFLGAFEHVDEVWVGSQHVADALTPVSPVPVVKIRQPVEVPHVERPVDRAALGLPEGFLFLYSFDYNSVFERKNPLGAIEAFTRAFALGSGPQLVIKSINHEHDPANHERLRAAAAARDDVHLIDRYVSREERDALTAACDCYVSLHRSEGFGFTVAEAMALGRPAIVTDYAGTREFVTADNAYPVRFSLVPIGPGADPYPADGEWAEPDLDHAAGLMRAVVADPAAARERGERAARDIAERHSAEAAAEVVTDRLQRIMFRGAPRAIGGAGLVDVGRLRERISTGPLGSANPRFGRPQKAAREGLLRVLKPYAVHERMVDGDIADGLEVLDRAVQAVTQGVTRLQGEPARVDDLVRQVDELRSDLGVMRQDLARLLAAFGARDGVIADGAGYPEAPRVPWTQEYVDAHRAFVTRALDDPGLLTRLRRGDELPDGYGIGFDERAVEFPWTASRPLGGRVLDAGSTLNHAHVLMRVRPRVDELTIVTLAPEHEAFTYLDVSYLYADLRELPFADGVFDQLVCLSTLEHVGMDNTQYGDRTERASDPGAALEAAVRELARVLAPGGTAFVTVPYGVAEDLGWQRVFAADGLDELVEAFAPAEQRRTFFRYDEAGWHRATAEECAGARYRDAFTDSEPAPDRAVAARAVACLELRR